MSEATSESSLAQNCDPQLPKAWCGVANVCGYVSSAVWLVVLLPQLYHNYKRGSVSGLSILWALANFTASTMNLIFVARMDLPLFTVISAVYMPIIEALILVQFLYYGTAAVRKKTAATVVCVMCWVVLVLVELLVPQWTSALQWIPVSLWSVETLFQVHVNEQRKSTSGQSSVAVLMTMVGKATDALSAFPLVMPTQTYVLTYFSSSAAYVNAIQLIAYHDIGDAYHPMGHKQSESKMERKDEHQHGHENEHTAPSDGLRSGEHEQGQERRDHYGKEQEDCEEIGEAALGRHDDQGYMTTADAAEGSVLHRRSLSIQSPECTEDVEYEQPHRVWPLQHVLLATLFASVIVAGLMALVSAEVWRIGVERSQWFLAIFMPVALYGTVGLIAWGVRRGVC